jgi:hypothetical protein
MAAKDAQQMTWCCMQKLRRNSGEEEDAQSTRVSHIRVSGDVFSEKMLGAWTWFLPGASRR